MEIKLYQIGSSDIAVKFEVIEKPNDWAKEIKRYTSKSATLQARYEYWAAFNDYAFSNNSFGKSFKKRKASRVLVSHSVDFDDKNQWYGQFDWIMDVAMKMKKAFKKHL